MKRLVITVFAVAVLSGAAAAQFMAPAEREMYRGALVRVDDAAKKAQASRITSRNGKFLLTIVKTIRETVANAASEEAVADCTKTSAAFIAQNYLNLLEANVSKEEYKLLMDSLDAPLSVKFQEEPFSIGDVRGAWYQYLSSITEIKRNSR